MKKGFGILAVVLAGLAVLYYLFVLTPTGAQILTTPTRLANQQAMNDMATKLKVSGYSKGKVTLEEVGYGQAVDYSVTATRVTNELDGLTPCRAAHDFAVSVADGHIIRALSAKVPDSQSINLCVANTLSYIANPFVWQAKHNGVRFQVYVSMDGFAKAGSEDAKSLTYEISALTSNGCGAACDGGMWPAQPQGTLRAYLNKLQDYRVSHHLEMLTKQDFANAGLDFNKYRVYYNKSGQIYQLGVHDSEWASEELCFSLLPWNSKVWGMKDPGSPRPFMNTHGADAMVSFGQFTTYGCM